VKWRRREALYLLSLGQSPYEGSAYHGAPLLLPLLGRAARIEAEPLARVAPFVAADLVAGLALWRLAVGTFRSGNTQILTSKAHLQGQSGQKYRDTRQAGRLGFSAEWVVRRRLAS